jgi:hypothetical protein
MLGMDTSSLFLGIVTGAIGTGYLVYGKKQKRMVPAVAGILLMVYPYFFENIWWQLIVGAALIAAPWVIKTD